MKKIRISLTIEELDDKGNVKATPVSMTTTDEATSASAGKEVLDALNKALKSYDKATPDK